MIDKISALNDPNWTGTKLFPKQMTVIKLAVIPKPLPLSLKPSATLEGYLKDNSIFGVFVLPKANIKKMRIKLNRWWGYCMLATGQTGVVK
jgi:hypothetical protein